MLNSETELEQVLSGASLNVIDDGEVSLLQVLQNKSCTSCPHTSTTADRHVHYILGFMCLLRIFFLVAFLFLV